MFKINYKAYLNYLRYQPELIFYFLFVCLISANGVIIPFGRDWTLPQLMAIAMIFFWVLKVWTSYEAYAKREMAIPVIPTILLAGWILLIGLSMVFAPPEPYSPFPTESLQSYDLVGIMYYFWIILDVVLMTVVFFIVKNGNLLTKTLRILIYSSGFYAAYGIYQYVMVSLLGVGSSSMIYAYNYEYLYLNYIVRLLSLSREPLYFANFISPVIILCIAVLVTKSSQLLKIPRRHLLFILVIDLIAFFMAKSTGGFVATLGSLLVIGLFYLKANTKKISIKKIIYGLGGILVFAFTFYQFFGREIERRFTRLLDPASGYTRIVSLIEGVENIWHSPITGFGLGHSKFFISVSQIHNAYLNIAAETGLISLVCFLSFILYLFVLLIKIYPRAGRYKGIVLGLIGALTYVLIQWLSFYAYVILFAWFLFGLILALPYSLKNRKRMKFILKYE